MKTLLLLSVIAVVISVLVVVINDDEPVTPEQAVIIPAEESAQSARRDVSPLAPLQPVLDAEVNQARIGYEKPNESAILVDVRMLRTRDWLVGDQLSINIPHTGYVLHTQIDEVREIAPGVMNVKSYPDETMANHILLTVSKNNTFLNLFTPEGEFELLGGQEYGWLVPSRTLGGPTHDDAIVIDPEVIAISEPADLEPYPDDE